MNFPKTLRPPQNSHRHNDLINKFHTQDPPYKIKVFKVTWRSSILRARARACVCLRVNANLVTNTEDL